MPQQHQPPVMESWLPEFRAAWLAYRRWHREAVPSVDVQRRYGRRWRWWALWERIWNAWVATDQVIGTLDEFLRWHHRFWQPLACYLDDPHLYDVAIELEWEEILATGPASLTTWGDVVSDTWHRMTESPPPLVGTTAATDSTSNPPPASSTDHSEPMQVSPASYPRILTQWRDALRQQGLSRSQSDKYRYALWQAMQLAGIDTPADLPEDVPAWSAFMRRAVQLWRRTTTP
ncbi:hypothetical protein TPY_2707 [Sulfobacillus acidophilus TPY]|uniref:Uncharacterized protein n=1 Tax=Sulfobacillus acidophilus (strain ATCC 700253 / DSM 10332 / NAL) TaxID=679936 RepID=G8TUM6_SULAD|nr:hypothetical protein TPY_2707 [Sulfobacillus acidophilus TPY]AEW04673.1 hypothetical protein Sulac_1173 [Sulfobacillus acidophilus DSM 10332]